MAIPGLAPPPGASTPRADAPAESAIERQRLAHVAQEFEAMLLLQMVRQMRQSMLSADPGGEGLGASTMSDTLDVELARQLSAQGGIGLATVIARGMSREAQPAGAPSEAVAVLPARAVARPTPSPHGTSAAPSGAGGAAWAAAATSGEAALRLPFDGATASAFGWRTDPLHGRQRFHAGVDLKAAYGRDVPVAAPGRVVFAGERGAYGQLVIVAHAHGVETRYAHLSAIAVRPGQQLATGEIVGRVGQSGRATGPHLHFEVLVNGARVDPAGFARLLAAEPSPGSAGE
jgi:murein DD-endopeptidase MepM/ murein hydrolase activator NlpD